MVKTNTIRKTGPASAAISWWRLARIALGACAVVFILFRLFAWWHGPARLISRFAAAVNARDSAAVLRFGDAKEIERLGLTAEKLRAILEDEALGPQGYTLRSFRSMRETRRERREHRDTYSRIFTMCDAEGKVVLDDRADHMPFAVAYMTGSGWKIGLSLFIERTLLSQPSSEDYRSRYVDMWNRAGVGTAPLVYYPVQNFWKDMTTGLTIVR